MPAPTQQQPSTQTFLDIFDITNDMIIMSDGAVSMILSVSAMNFGLLSEDEQDATIYAYAALLNSLSFPVEIVISSQPKDVTTYLRYVQDQEEQTTNELYKKRLQEYRLFVESLVQEQNVLDKRFYIVIPLSAIEMGLSNQSIVPGTKAKSITSYEKNYIIEKATTNLFPRRDHVIDQLARIGLYSRQLSTQELIQMLYASYNPESYEGQKVTETTSYTTPLVQAQIQGGYVLEDATNPPIQQNTQDEMNQSFNTTQPESTQPTEAVITPPEMSTSSQPMINQFSPQTLVETIPTNQNLNPQSPVYIPQSPQVFTNIPPTELAQQPASGLENSTQVQPQATFNQNQNTIGSQTIVSPIPNQNQVI